MVFVLWNIQSGCKVCSESVNEVLVRQTCEPFQVSQHPRWEWSLRTISSCSSVWRATGSATTSAPCQAKLEQNRRTGTKIRRAWGWQCKFFQFCLLLWHQIQEPVFPRLCPSITQFSTSDFCALLLFIFCCLAEVETQGVPPSWVCTISFRSLPWWTNTELRSCFIPAEQARETTPSRWPRLRSSRSSFKDELRRC